MFPAVSLFPVVINFINLSVHVYSPPFFPKLAKLHYSLHITSKTHTGIKRLIYSHVASETLSRDAANMKITQRMLHGSADYDNADLLLSFHDSGAERAIIVSNSHSSKSNQGLWFVSKTTWRYSGSDL